MARASPASSQALTNQHISQRSAVTYDQPGQSPVAITIAARCLKPKGAGVQEGEQSLGCAVPKSGLRGALIVTDLRSVDVGNSDRLAPIAKRVAVNDTVLLGSSNTETKLGVTARRPFLPC